MSITPAPLWEVFHPADGRPIGYTAAWHWEPAISAVAHAAKRDPRPLDAELVQLEVFAESLPVGCVQLAVASI